MYKMQELKSSQGAFAGASTYNQIRYIVEQCIREMINTSELVRVDSCSSSGSDAATGTVSATPLITQIDADENAVEPVSIPRMPHVRIQGGCAALIIDPVANDIGVASFCKRDSSTVSTGETNPQRPGSYRQFDLADGVYLGSVLNTAPTVYIELQQDNSIIIHATGGITITGDIQLNGSLTATGDVVANGISLTGHTHSGCQGGSTGTPQ